MSRPFALPYFFFFFLQYPSCSSKSRTSSSINSCSHRALNKDVFSGRKKKSEVDIYRMHMDYRQPWVKTKKSKLLHEHGSQSKTWKGERRQTLLDELRRERPAPSRASSAFLRSNKPQSWLLLWGSSLGVSHAFISLFSVNLYEWGLNVKAQWKFLPLLRCASLRSIAVWGHGGMGGGFSN